MTNSNNSSISTIVRRNTQRILQTLPHPNVNVNAPAATLLENKQSITIDPSVKLMAGALAGVAEALFLTPLDVTKTRLQLDKTGQYRNMIHCGSTLYKAEGFFGLYKGFVPWTTHVITKNGTRFYFNALYRKALTSKETGKVSGTNEFVAGALAGATEALFIVTPFEVIKTRLQGQDKLPAGATQQLKYNGTIGTARVIIQTEGVLALWKGLIPTMGRQGLNQACSFWSNNMIKKYVWKVDTDKGEKLPAWKSMVTGMLGAIPGPCINGPMDVVKTRLMAQENVVGAAKESVKYRGMIHGITVIAKEEGVGALYKGLIPRLTRLCPSYGIQWLVMDTVTAKFGKPTGSAMR